MSMSMRGHTSVTGHTTLRLELPSRISMLDTADALVGRLAVDAGFDPDAAEWVQTAVHEAVVNAIVHANRESEARRVTLEIELDPGGLEVRVRDEGRGFDPARVPDPCAPENLSRSTGRGIFLMRTLMDEVAFRRLPSGGAEVTMRKRLSPAEESAASTF
jgi:serine/threonine-protein kinase RsbW